MKRKIVSIMIGTFALIIFGLSLGCSNHDAAQLGALIGRTIGKPIGTAATAVDETFRTVGDVVNENPRRKAAQAKQKMVQRQTTGNRDDSYYYRTEVLVKTRGPAQIESLQLQQTEDVSEFWRD